MIGGEELVTPRKAKGTQHTVGPGRGVGHQRQVLRLAAEKGGERRSRRIERGLQVV